MKKYYYQSVFRSLIYLIIALFLIGGIVLCFFADEMHSGVILIITVFSISVVTILIWFGFSLSMRIQIDFDNEELYIRQPYFIKRIKFEEILSIEIIDYKETAFEIVLTTRTFTKRTPYARYLKRRPSKKIKSILSELKQDLLKINK